tara:strand:- start:408 stop:668 length:261 start_codon:yes stop_codon:yes gene_type:complete
MYIRAKVLIVVLLIIFLNPSISFSKITSEQEAEVFLNTYCFELLNAVESLHEEQKVLVEEKKWEQFYEKGSLILAISNIYGNLCKY